MADYTIEDVFEEVYRREFAEFDDLESLPDPRFSLRHKIRMSRIFKRFRKNTAKLYAVHIRFSRRTVLAFMMIILLATITACAATLIIGEFIGKEHKDNTQLFALNIEGAPEIIEDIYQLTVIPDGYECTSDDFVIKIHNFIFTNRITNKTLSLYQCVKSEFDGHYDNEGYLFVETKVNEYPAIYIDYSQNDIEYGLVLWDNGSYIFELCGYFSKDELITMAESVEISQE